MLTRAGVRAASVLCRLSGFRRESGQTLTEYALILTVMSLGLVAALTFLRNELDTFFRTAIDKF